MWAEKIRRKENEEKRAVSCFYHIGVFHGRMPREHAFKQGRKLGWQYHDVFKGILLIVVHLGDGRADPRKIRTARDRQRRPFGYVDDARSSVRSRRTGREGPVVGRGDEIALVCKIFIHLAVKLEIAVADRLRIRLGGRRLIVLVRRVVRRSRAGGEQTERKACGERNGERQNRAALPFFFSEIMCHINSL